MARGVILLDYNGVTVDENFSGVAVCDALFCSDFLWDNDSSELVNVSHDSGGFHNLYLTFSNGAIVRFCKF